MFLFNHFLGLHAFFFNQMETVCYTSSFIILLSNFYLKFFLGCAAFGILGPQLGIEPAAPAVEAWSPHHWTTREVLYLFFN